MKFRKLKLKEIDHGIAIFKNIQNVQSKNVTIFEVWRSRKNEKEQPMKGGMFMIGYIVSRTDYPHQNNLRLAFAQDCCLSAFGSPIIFDGEEGDTAFVNWELKELTKSWLSDGDETFAKIKSSKLIALIEPKDTPRPYFGNLNHYVRTS